MDFKIPVILTPQSEGGCTVTLPLLPEFLTEEDSIGETLEHANDALIGRYRDMRGHRTVIAPEYLDSRCQRSR